MASCRFVRLYRSDLHEQKHLFFRTETEVQAVAVLAPRPTSRSAPPLPGPHCGLSCTCPKQVTRPATKKIMYRSL